MSLNCWEYLPVVGFNVSDIELLDPVIKKSICLLANLEHIMAISVATRIIYSSKGIVKSSLIVRPTVSRLICLGIKHPSGAYDQIFIIVRQLRVC
jgi:hypothetical protein